jgi:hypothetical protein
MRMWMKRAAWATAVASLAGGTASAVGGAGVSLAVTDPARDDRPVIQLALVLDTSSSMDGLIEQAKSALWAVVNELSVARHGDETPRLRVALIEYGNNGIPRETGWVRLRTHFTSDLDLLSEQLFGLTTNGGEEWCGHALSFAADQLSWFGAPGGSASALPRHPVTMPPGVAEGVRDGLAGGALDPGATRDPIACSTTAPVTKLVVIAGNEAFTQGPTSAYEVLSGLRQEAVTVNTVFCGPRDEGSRTGWEAGARHGGGLYASIDSDRRVVDPVTPYDARIRELNRALNATYLAYGVRGRDLADRQIAQDRLNERAGYAADRAAAKASVVYVQAEWDLIDAIDAGRLKLADLDRGALPEPLRGLPIEAQMSRVDGLRAERAGVRSRIRDVAAQREAHRP